MRIAIVGLLLLTAACSSEADSDRPQQERDQRAHDSAVAESSLPGSQGVQGAMSVADSAAARRAREDSIARGQ